MSVAYFETLNRLLAHAGTGQAQLVLDLDRLDENLAQLRAQLSAKCKIRIVVKSLASAALLQYIAQQLSSQRFMVFHFPHLQHIQTLFPQGDILLGKPMPIQALQQSDHQILGSQNIQWLIDSVERLNQYLHFAQSRQIQLRVNLEIDIGLHRGGFADESSFVKALQLIQANAPYLKLSGLMGYDAHVSKLPQPWFKPEIVFQRTQQRYQFFLQCLGKYFSEAELKDLCLNGAVSASFGLHQHGTICNDLAVGSALIKPLDFELSALKVFRPAMWIAAPVLKVIPIVQLPEIPLWARLFRNQHAVFIYGGYWRGKCEYPEGVKPHALYGRSSNQEMLQLPKGCQIQVDDYVFIRPSQTEVIISQFAQLHVIRDMKLYAVWSTFRE
jgi:D-serine deaminase-like pyridoxal phosphate-dependent protein